MAIDLYSLAHKPLRQAVGDSAVVLGAVDVEDLSLVVDPVSAAIGELHGHARHEDEFIEPVLDRFLPDIALEIAAQHARLGGVIDAVQRQLDALAGCSTAPSGAPIALYRAYQRMAAANLIHLDYEETVVMPALWTAAPPEALAEVMAAFNAAHPEAVELFHRWPDALTRKERAAFGITTTSTAAPTARS
jgi:hypothetical protein